MPIPPSPPRPGSVPGHRPSLSRLRSDLVFDSKLEATQQGSYIQHTIIQRSESAGERCVRVEERWVREGTLGKGAHGFVYRERLEGQATTLRALKEIKKGTDVELDYSRELEAIAKFSHIKYSHCFVTSRGWFELGDSIFITMEYLELGDLERHISKPLAEIEARQISSQVIEGLGYMHESGFVHRDLKPGNIMVVAKRPWFVKIADFGVSKRQLPDVTMKYTSKWLSPDYAAPEQFPFNPDKGAAASKHPFAMDIWSLGAIAYRVLTTAVPFDAAELIMYAKSKGQLPDAQAARLRTRHVSDRGVEFIAAAMAASAASRPTAASVREHPWFSADLPPAPEDGESSSLRPSCSTNWSDYAGTSNASVASNTASADWTDNHATVKHRAYALEALAETEACDIPRGTNEVQIVADESMGIITPVGGRQELLVAKGKAAGGRSQRDELRGPAEKSQAQPPPLWNEPGLGQLPRSNSTSPQPLQNGSLTPNGARLRQNVSLADNEEQFAPFTGLGVPSKIPRGPRVRPPMVWRSDVSDLGRAHHARLRSLPIAAEQTPKSAGPHTIVPSRGLRKDLQRALVRAQGEGARGSKRFLPVDDIQRLINEDSVTAALRGSRKTLTNLVRRTNDGVRHTARDVCQPSRQRIHSEHTYGCSYRIIFAILARMERERDIVKFVGADICDAYLPLTFMSRGYRGRLCSAPTAGLELGLPQGWDLAKLHKFGETQWTMLAPFFAKDEDGETQHYVLPEKAILPFSSWERLERPGGFGKVFKAQIHHQHHALYDTEQGDLWVAIKKLKTTNKHDFRREVEILKRFGRPSHEHRHLMTLLFTYEQHGRFHLVMAWADADLLGYWEKVRPEPEADRQTSLWLAEQCHGIADGLRKIHQCMMFDQTDLIAHSASSAEAADDCMAPPASPTPSGSRSGAESPDGPRSRKPCGRHGDIKADNILWHPSPEGSHGYGTLKISNFSLTALTAVEVTSRRTRGRVPNSLSYRPPELDMDDGEISGFCDVWAPGRPHPEFVTWLLGGWQAVHAFYRSRLFLDEKLGMPIDNFFVIHKTNDPSQARASVKPSVVEFVQGLHSHPQCTDHLRDFLHLIMESMVVVNVHSQHKSSENGEQAEFTPYRKTCLEVLSELSRPYEECLSRPNYTSQNEGSLGK